MLWVDDFDSGQNMNLLGGPEGAWEINPYDDAQYCKIAFSNDVKVGETGAALQIKYSVNSTKPVANGYWTKLNDADLTPYKYLIFFVRGDPKGKFTSEMVIELKNEKESSKVKVTGITKDWQRIIAPLSLFDIQDWSHMAEFVIVFEKENVTSLTGTLYLDDVVFTDEAKIERSMIDGSTASLIVPAAKQKKVEEKKVEEKKAIETLEKAGLEVKKSSEEIVITWRVLFPTGQWAVRKSQWDILRKVAALIRSKPDYQVQITGHTDNVGGDKYNLNLSKKRAESIKQFLIAFEELNEGIIQTQGMGKNSPVTSNQTPKGRALNRRVEFKLKPMEQQR